MNLSDLIHAVWKDPRVKELRLRKDEVKIIGEVFVEHIRKGLLERGIIKIQSLFTLEIRKAKGRKIRNPRTNKEMYSQDYNKIGIIPSKKLKDGLKDFKK